VLDSLAEVCESISDVDAAQRYKSDADQLAATFYGTPTSPNPPSPQRDSASSPPLTPVTTPRDPGSSRRLMGVGSGVAAPGKDDVQTAGVSETSIREGVATMISRLGLSSPVPPDDEVDDSLNIRRAERDLQETVSRTGGTDVIGLSVPSPQESTHDDLRPSSEHQVDNRPASSSRHQTSSSVTVSGVVG